MSALLEVDRIAAGYGQNQVVRGVSVTVSRGESVGLLGPNGHGKTTLLRTISGLHRPTAGRTGFSGHDITDRSPHEIVGLGLVHVAQGNPLFPECTVAEHLRLGALARPKLGGRDERLEHVLALFPRLRERQSQPCGTLSGGERQMLAVGIGLMSAPELLMLDEPTLGLSPKVKLELRHAIAQIRASGVSLMIVDGDIEFMLALTDRWLAVESGRVTRETASSEAVAREEIVAMYFAGEGRTRVA